MRRSRFFFAGLYVLQGAAFAYAVNFQKPYLASRGVPKATLGLLTSALLLPFVLKVGLGWWSDRSRSRKGLMALGLGTFALCYLTLAFVDPGERLFTFAGLTWIASLALALFDTCADGWAIDVAGAGDEGPIQAAMVAGKSLGAIAGAGVFGALALGPGYPAIFRALATLALVALGWTLVEPYEPRRREAGAKLDWSAIAAPDFLWFGAFGILYSVASFGVDGLVTLHLMETRLANAAVIGWFGVARGLGCLLGAWGYVRLAGAVGDARARVIAPVLLGFGCLVPLGGWPVGTAGSVWGFVWGLQETAFVTLAMRLSRGRWAATLFAIAMIFSNVGTALGEALGAPIVPRFGYAAVFTGAAVVAWTAAALAYKISVDSGAARAPLSND